MKTIKQACILFVLLVFSVFANAQVKNAVVDQKAQEIMKKVAQKVASHQALQIDFTSIAKDKEDNSSTTTKGSILMQGDKYRITMKDQVIYCDGATMWYYLPDDKEVQIHKFDPKSSETMNFAKLLEEYDKNYRPKLIKEETKGNTTYQIVDLTPIKGAAFYKVRLTINKANSQLSQMEFSFKEGKSLTYKVDTYKINPTVSASDFVFNTSANPSVEVIDMR